MPSMMMMIQKNWVNYIKNIRCFITLGHTHDDIMSIINSSLQSILHFKSYVTDVFLPTMNIKSFLFQQISVNKL